VSSRIQILVGDTELERLKEIARSEHVSLGEWARRVLRRAADESSGKPASAKLLALHKASLYSFPTADIEEIERSISEGYQNGLP